MLYVSIILHHTSQLGLRINQETIGRLAYQRQACSDCVWASTTEYQKFRLAVLSIRVWMGSADGPEPVTTRGPMIGFTPELGLGPWPQAEGRLHLPKTRSYPLHPGCEA